MKSKLFKWMVIGAVSIGFAAATMSAEAYRCAWRYGQRVCWHDNNYNAGYRYKNTNYKNYGNRCYWVKGHWYRGYYYQGHKVCR